MRNDSPKDSILGTVRPVRVFPSSALRAARHFRDVRLGAKATTLADALAAEPGVEAVAVVDESGRARGLVTRERLFSLLGKPFGREVLSRVSCSELVEAWPVFPANEGIFTVAEDFLGLEDEPGIRWALLEDEEGRFMGALSSQDLANYLSRITQEDIALASQLQERLLAGNDEARGEGWRLEAWSRSAKGVGGDFWRSRVLPDGRVFMALCDVSGKGVAASLVVAMAWGMLAMYDFSRGLEGLLVAMNEAIVRSFHLEKYLTGFFALYHPDSGRLDLADMGHSHAILYRDGAAHRPKSKARNLPIGIETSLSPALAHWRLKPGDALLVFSDGFTEQEDAAGREFGERGLAKAAGAALRDSRPLAEALPAALDEHRGRSPQQDDMSFFALVLDPCPPAAPSRIVDTLWKASSRSSSSSASSRAGPSSPGSSSLPAPPSSIAS